MELSALPTRSTVTFTTFYYYWKWSNCSFQEFTLKASRKQPTTKINSLFLTEQEILWYLVKRCPLTPATHLNGNSISLWDKYTKSLRKRIYVFMKNTPPSHQYLGSTYTEVSLKWFCISHFSIWRAWKLNFHKRTIAFPRSPNEQRP